MTRAHININNVIFILKLALKSFHESALFVAIIRVQNHDRQKPSNKFREILKFVAIFIKQKHKIFIYIAAKNSRSFQTGSNNRILRRDRRDWLLCSLIRVLETFPLWSKGRRRGRNARSWPNSSRPGYLRNVSAKPRTRYPYSICNLNAFDFFPFRQPALE